MKTADVAILSKMLLLLFCVGAGGYVQGQALTNREFIFPTSDHIGLPVKIAGQGRPCLFVPGGPGGGFRSFEQLGGNHLEKELTMIWMDQRGSGSAEKAADYSLDRLVQDMEELRANLGIEKMYLLSHSFGGIILLQYAMKYPQHVEGLILVNSTLHFFNPQSLREQLEYGYELLGTDTLIRDTSQAALIAANGSVRRQLNKKHLGYKFLTDSLSTVIALNTVDSLYPRINDLAYAVLGPIIDPARSMRYPEYYKDYIGLTARVDLPVLVIAGTRDHAIGTGHFKLFRFPKHRSVLIEGGHLLYYEENKAFIGAVRQFITRRTAN